MRHTCQRAGRRKAAAQRRGEAARASWGAGQARRGPSKGARARLARLAVALLVAALHLWRVAHNHALRAHLRPRVGPVGAAPRHQPKQQGTSSGRPGARMAVCSVTQSARSAAARVCSPSQARGSGWSTRAAGRQRCSPLRALRTGGSTPRCGEAAPRRVPAAFGVWGSRRLPRHGARVCLPVGGAGGDVHHQVDLVRALPWRGGAPPR